MRLDSPAVIATCGTVAVHILLAIAGDAIVVLNPIERDKPAPRIELVDIEPVVLPPPPPLPVPEPQVKETPEPQLPEKVEKQVRRAAPPPPSNEPPPPITDPDPNPSGGAPVATMTDVPPGALGVPVAVGKPNTGRIGRGGTGTGTGAGSGAGSSDEPPKPVSVATIKQRAMPKGDFGYVSTKDYPPQAKALGIEGQIKVRLVVDETGKVKSTVLLNKLGHGLDELALERAKKIEFEPAKDSDDKPVASVVVWTFTMTLPPE